jgi:hypothetical protein
MTINIFIGNVKKINKKVCGKKALNKGKSGKAILWKFGVGGL